MATLARSQRLMDFGCSQSVAQCLEQNEIVAAPVWDMNIVDDQRKRDD